MSETTQFKRNELGLIDGVEYAYLPDGRIDWRKMIKKEHVVVQDSKKSEFLNKYGKELQDLDLSTVEDKYLLILLSGIKELAQIRGFNFVQQKVDHADDNQVIVTCTIQFIPNFETGGEKVCFSDVGGASRQNTPGIFSMYLPSIAANRAFVRAVRNFLGINITGKDEMPESVKEDAPVSSSSAFQPFSVLAEKAKKAGLSFETIKNACLTKYKENMSANPAEWTGFDSINRSDAFFIIGKLEEKK